MITTATKRKSIGQMLVAKGLLTQQALEAVLETQKSQGRQKLLGELLVEQGLLTEEQLWTRYGENQNAAGNLVLHLTGNVRQWILSGIGGAEDTRVRDAEFAARGSVPAGELIAGLRGVIEAAVKVIGGMNDDAFQ